MARFLSVVATVLLVLWLANSIRLAGGRAERGLHATRLVLVAVQRYVELHRVWPASWRELETVTATDGTMYSWPRDSAEVRKYVAIDFDLTLDAAARQTADSFGAVKPIGPTYAGYREYVVSLLAVVRKEANKRSDQSSGGGPLPFHD